MNRSDIGVYGLGVRGRNLALNFEEKGNTVSETQSDETGWEISRGKWNESGRAAAKSKERKNPGRFSEIMPHINVIIAAVSVRLNVSNIRKYRI